MVALGPFLWLVEHLEGGLIHAPHISPDVGAALRTQASDRIKAYYTIQIGFEDFYKYIRNPRYRMLGGIKMAGNIGKHMHWATFLFASLVCCSCFRKSTVPKREKDARCKRRGTSAAIWAVLISVCLSGCADKRPIMSPPQDCLEHVAKPDIVTVPESVGVYIDTTPSMKGFLTSPEGSSSLYSLCLHEMGKLVTGKYNQLSYYRVDTPLWPVEDTVDVFEEARKDYYYYDSRYFPEIYAIKEEEKDRDVEIGYDSLCLTTALNEGTNQDLFILVTDFYENSSNNNANVNKLIAKINELASSGDGKIFGLIGVKSAFSGEIYDTGPNGESVSYGTKPGVTEFRSFYIILRGYPQHVQSFYDNMMERLESLGAQKEVDYTGCLFYKRDFVELDYTALIGCVNQPTPRKEFLWPYGADIVVKDTNGQVGETAIPAYNYKKYYPRGQQEESDNRMLYFAYSIGKAYQEEFHSLISEIPQKETMEFYPGSPKEVYIITCNTEDIKATRWNGTDTFDETTSIGYDCFEVKQIYYDVDDESLYVAIRLEDTKFTEGFWRLQWKSILDTTEELEPWWEQWHSPSGANVDYSKTERLKDYIEPILKEMHCSEQNIISGVAYLNIKE